jgi:hypothetical protein
MLHSNKKKLATRNLILQLVKKRNMKLINKLFILVLALGLSTTSCDNTDLDLLDNPNAITPDQASLNDLYNNIQLTFRNVYLSAEGNPGSIARMYHAGAFIYENMTTNTTYNGIWNNVYSGLLPDIDALLNLADAGGFDVHAGTAKIMEAYSMMALVDLLKDVPYSEATQGTDVISPSADQGSAVYSAATALLDEAIAQLSGTSAAAPTYEGFYGGDTDQWIKFANTLKLRAALNTGDAGAINAAVSSGVIEENSDNFEFKYGNQRNNPNSRHWMYNNHYEVGDGNYQSNYMMWLMLADKETVDGVTLSDPRIRYYFYRKVDDAAAQDATTYSCHFSTFPEQDAKPAHWLDVDPDLPYCIVPNSGYSGRDHGNGEGIPPDGPIRTSYGLYPGGGQFDDDGFSDTRQRGTTGGLGQGVLPIMQASLVDLLRAEAALTLGTSDDARALIESGIRKSMDRVESFESLVPSTMGDQRTLRDGSSGTVKQLYGFSAARKDTYVNAVLALFDAADNDGKLDLVAKEIMISAFGNGIEAYNLYRRTGKPSNMQPALEPAFGQFPYSFLYPTNTTERNANVTQKSLADRVFWDKGLEWY